MKQLVVIMTVMISLIACEPGNRVFSEHQDLSPKLEWLKQDVKEFKVPIEDNSLSYNLSLSFRYIVGYSSQYAKVKVTETSPSGIENVMEYDLKVVEDNGEYIGEMGFEIWDSEHLVESNKQYEETGIYTYVIEHNMPEDPMTSAMEIGVLLDKSE